MKIIALAAPLLGFGLVVGSGTAHDDALLRTATKLQCATRAAAAPAIAPVADRERKPEQTAQA
jgi:hypothetical protein